MKSLPLGREEGRPIQAHAFDIQAIVGSGFAPLRYCTYHLLRVVDVPLACAWLRRLIDSSLVRSVADLGKGEHGEVATVAFSYEGLRLLRLEERDDFPFPTAFRMGMTHPVRAALIGDGDVSSWRWGDHVGDGRSPTAAHVVVAHFRKVAAVRPDGPFEPTVLRARSSGLEPVAVIDVCPGFTRKVCNAWESTEPFGFRDGIAQPIVEGLRSFCGALTDEGDVGTEHDNRIKPGEFVLGHLTEYNEPSYCPDVRDWHAHTLFDGHRSSFGLNGTYLAIRQIRQKVDLFRQFECMHPAPNGAVTVAERMIGRRKHGTPLVTRPTEPATINDFRYRRDDSEGFQCPIGAHIRRANPRDTLGWDTRSGIALSKRHRLLRRGRVYRDSAGCNGEHCDDPGVRERCGQGILFIAINSDLERQFELVLKRWLHNTTFNAYKAFDPIAGPDLKTDFTVQGMPAGMIYPDVTSFTEVVGAGYFFAPSLGALRFIATRA